VVIDEVRIVEVHTPPFALRRETAKKQHLGILRQERPKRMILYAILAAGYIFCVQIRCHSFIPFFCYLSAKIQKIPDITKESGIIYKEMVDC
jgi:hypothetical protein